MVHDSLQEAGRTVTPSPTPSDHLAEGVNGHSPAEPVVLMAPPHVGQTVDLDYDADTDAKQL